MKEEINWIKRLNKVGFTLKEENFNLKGRDKVTVLCSEGHEQIIQLQHFFSNQRKQQCYLCNKYKNKKISFDKLKQIKKENVKIIDDFSIEKFDWKNYLEVECKIHGKFLQLPSNYIKYDCEKCSRPKGYEKRTKKISRFIEQAQLIHNNKYSYEKFEYIGAHNKSIIICPIHGEFLQSAANHLANHGCFSCRSISSKNEEIIEKYLINNNISFIKQKNYSDLRTKTKNKLFYDFYIEKYNLLIEYDGEHHYRPIIFNKNLSKEQHIILFERRQMLDKIKTEYALSNNINLERISYRENTENAIEQIIIKYKGKT